MVVKEVFEVKSEGHKSSGKFSISSVGCCWKTKYRELKGLYKRDFDEKTKRIFEIGDAFHRIGMRAFFEKAQQLGLHVVSSEINIPEQKNISGRTDCIISDDKTGEMYVVDFKSCSNFVFDKVQNGEVAQNYKDQLNLYLHFFKLKKGYLIFMNKDKGTIEEFEVIYDEARALENIMAINDFFDEYVNKNIEPPIKCDNPYGCEICNGKS